MVLDLLQLHVPFKLEKVILVEKFPAVGGNTVRAGGPMNDPDPAWQYTFPANPGEAYNLQELHDIDESTIDPEFLSDFRSLKDRN